MPAKRTPKKATPAAAEVAPTPEPAEEPPAEKDADEPAEAEAAPMNRAERRAKGKVRPQPGFGPNKIVGSRGPASAQRNFANRRSG